MDTNMAGVSKLYRVVFSSSLNRYMRIKCSELTALLVVCSFQSALINGVAACHKAAQQHTVRLKARASVITAIWLRLVLKAVINDDYPWFAARVPTLSLVCQSGRDDADTARFWVNR